MKLKRAWTEDDDAQLRQLAMKISPERIAVRLKRTKSAIVDRAFKLGLRVTLPRKKLSMAPSNGAQVANNVGPRA